MSVRFSANTMGYSRSATLPANTSFTLMADVQVVTDRGAATQQPIFALADAGLTDLVSLSWETTAADAVMRAQVFDAGVITSSGIFASRPATNQVFSCYLKCSGTGANLVEAGWRSAQTTWVTVQATLGTTIAAPTQLLIAKVSTTFLNGRMQNVRMWDRPLSTPELWEESKSPVPVSLFGLNAFWPLSHANDLFDRGGNDRILTKVGAPTTEFFDFPRAKTKRRQPIVSDVPAVVSGLPFFMQGDILTGYKQALAGGFQ